MKDTTVNCLARAASLLAARILAACTAGEVKDTDGVALAQAEVTAYGRCTGAGCAANELATPIPGGSFTGYRTTANSDGHYFYDPYAEVVAPEDAMAIDAGDDSGQGVYKLQYSKPGYQDTWMDYTPDFQNDQRNGNNYLITAVPEVYLCADDAPDTDGDRICDDAELRYGADPLKTDTDGDGTTTTRNCLTRDPR
jgi:hypothetical protein